MVYVVFTWTSKMAKTMDPILPILFWDIVPLCWALLEVQVFFVSEN